MADDPSVQVKAEGADDTATAILRPKRSPNRLVVDDAASDDSSVATISAGTMETLGLFRGAQGCQSDACTALTHQR
jgi:transitional endoplasmic reticulum ATPase